MTLDEILDDLRADIETREANNQVYSQDKTKDQVIKDLIAENLELRAKLDVLNS